MKRIIVFMTALLWPLNMFLNWDRIKPNFETVFLYDYQAQQLVLRNINLYPNIILARTFQNKPRIYLNRYINNFFMLSDPNYYFFAMHPIPAPGNINMQKFPFPAITFLILGLVRPKKILITILLVLFLSLSIFKNMEGLDFILWLPILLIIADGTDYLNRKNKMVFNVYSLFFLIFTLPEVIRSFLNK